MNLTLRAATVMLAGLASTAALADDLNDVRDHWRRHDWAYVAEHAPTLRRQPFGRTMELDYMLGTAMCRMPDTEVQATGCKFLRWCLSRYDDIPKDARDVFTQEADQCGKAGRGEPMFVAAAKSVADSAGISIRSKDMSGAADEKAVVRSAVRRKFNVPVEVLNGRRTGAGDAAVARDIAQGLASGAMRRHIDVTADGRFTIADCGAGLNPPQLLERLTQYSDFFAREFGIARPGYAITVYLFRDQWELQRAAEALHGLDLPPRCVGYSDRDDMSLLAWTSPKADGTVYHELFHLWVRSDFGDCPPWLDEGLAAVFEASRVEGEKIVGLDNWRRAELGRQAERALDLRTLITTNWGTMDAMDHPDDMRDRQSHVATYATARYFMLYAQSQNKLGALYRALQVRTPFDIKGTPEEDTLATVEQVFGESIEPLNTHFREWLLNTFTWDNHASNEPAHSNVNPTAR